MEPEQIDVSSKPTQLSTNFPSKVKSFWVLVFSIIIIAGIASWTAILFYPKQTTKNLPVSVNETDNWKTYRNDVYGFEMGLPPGWVQHISPEAFERNDFVLLNFASPEAQGYKNYEMYGGEINVWIYDNPKSLPIKEFFNGESKPNIFDEFGDNIQIKYQNITIDGREGIRIDGYPGATTVDMIVINDESRFIEIEIMSSLGLTDQIFSTFRFISREIVINGYYIKSEKIGFDEERVLCDNLLVVGGDENFIKKYSDLAKEGNTINYLNDSNQLVVNLEIDNLDNTSINNILNSTKNNKVSLVIEEKIPTARGVQPCFSFFNIKSVK